VPPFDHRCEGGIAKYTKIKCLTYHRADDQQPHDKAVIVHPIKCMQVYNANERQQGLYSFLLNNHDTPCTRATAQCISIQPSQHKPSKSGSNCIKLT